MKGGPPSGSECAVLHQGKKRYGTIYLSCCMEIIKSIYNMFTSSQVGKYLG